MRLGQRTTDAPALSATAQVAEDVFAADAQVVTRSTAGPASALLVVSDWLFAWDKAKITARATAGRARKRGVGFIGRSSGLRSGGRRGCGRGGRSNCLFTRALFPHDVVQCFVSV